MNPLLRKFEEYKSIVGYKFVYEISNGTQLTFTFNQKEFIHLIGLHKLVDIPIIQRYLDDNYPNYSARYLLSKIRKEISLTDSIIRSSIHFSEIEDRYNSFTKTNLLGVIYTDVIIDFNPSLANSILKAKYVLYEKMKTGGYNNLFIGCGAKGTYVESYFPENSNQYICGQNTFAVSKVTIYDKEGNVYFTDSFT